MHMHIHITGGEPLRGESLAGKCDESLAICQRFP